MMLQGGVVVSHETIRQWCVKFGQTYANGLRRRRARPGDKWHLDEVFLTIHGQRQYLWRAVDQDGKGTDLTVHRPEHLRSVEDEINRPSDGPRRPCVGRPVRRLVSLAGPAIVATLTGTRRALTFVVKPRSASSSVIRWADHLWSRRQVSILSITQAGVAFGL